MVFSCKLCVCMCIIKVGFFEQIFQVEVWAMWKCYSDAITLHQWVVDHGLRIPTTKVVYHTVMLLFIIQTTTHDVHMQCKHCSTQRCLDTGNIDDSMRNCAHDTHTHVRTRVCTCTYVVCEWYIAMVIYMCMHYSYHVGRFKKEASI